MRYYFRFDDNQTNHLQNLQENQQFLFFENGLRRYFEMVNIQNENWIRGYFGGNVAGRAQPIYFKFRQDQLNPLLNDIEGVILIEVGLPKAIMVEIAQNEPRTS